MRSLYIDGDIFVNSSNKKAVGIKKDAWVDAENLVITGGFENSVNLGGETFSARNHDGFVAMFAP